MSFFILFAIFLRFNQSGFASPAGSISALFEKASACNFHKSAVCNPDGVLNEDKRKSLEIILESGLSRTVCFCDHPCSLLASDKRLVFGILFLADAPPLDGPHLAERLRSHLALGSCKGNDVFILAIGNEISVAYGPLVQKKLLPCMPNPHTKYEVHTDPIDRIHQVVFTLKSLLIQSCVCRTCDTPQFWFKLIAMLLACLSLLVWLSLFGRRIYLRRFTVMSATAYDGTPDRNSFFSSRYNAPDSRRHITLDRGQSRINVFGRADLSRPARTSVRPTGPAQSNRRYSPPPPDYSQIAKSQPVAPCEIPKSDTSRRSSTNTTNPNDFEVDSRPPSYSDVLAHSQQQRQLQQNLTASEV